MKNADLLNKLCELYEKSSETLEDIRKADAKKLIEDIKAQLESSAAAGQKKIKLDVRADLVKEITTFCAGNYLKLENQGGGTLNTIVISGWAE